MVERERVYRRRDLHEALGGQERGRIGTPHGAPIVLLDIGESGVRFGYRDGWEADGTYRYFGEG